jgi:hypothetical protein
MAGEASARPRLLALAARREPRGQNDRGLPLKRVGQRNLVLQRLDSLPRLGLVEVWGELTWLVGFLAQFPEFQRLGARHLAAQPFPNGYHFLLSFSYP